MRYPIAVFTALILCFASCKSDDYNSGSDTKFSKNIDFPLNPCDYITREIVLFHFDVQIEELTLMDENRKSSTKYSKCGYQWKKDNYDEIQSKRTDMMLAYATKGMNKNDDNAKDISLSDLTSLESPNNQILIGHFREYDNNKVAMTSFKNSHHVPTKEEMKKLHDEIDKQADKKGLNKNQKKVSKELSGGIGSSLKFTKVDGIGDQAFYDHLSRSLDVRFGTFSFSVFIDTELDFESNIEIAKKVAIEVWEKL